MCTSIWTEENGYLVGNPNFLAKVGFTVTTRLL